MTNIIFGYYENFSFLKYYQSYSKNNGDLNRKESITIDSNNNSNNRNKDFKNGEYDFIQGPHPHSTIAKDGFSGHVIWLMDEQDGLCLGLHGRFSKCGDTSLWFAQSSNR